MGSQGLAAGESGFQVVPEGGALPARAPAEADLAALAQAWKVSKPLVDALQPGRNRRLVASSMVK
jgi:hypothetical protein